MNTSCDFAGFIGDETTEHEKETIETNLFLDSDDLNRPTPLVEDVTRGIFY